MGAHDKAEDVAMDRKLRMGMVGGGKGSQMGSVHRIAAQMDSQIELVCGSFSSLRAQSIECGHALRLPTERIYATYRDMLRAENKRPVGDRMDFVLITTPNHMHYPIAMAAMDAGFHVACDKPMTMNLEEAINLSRKIAQKKRLFCLTHSISGYPMLREARQLIRKSKIGNIRRVVVEYPQGSLAARIETAGQKQAIWRTDPKRAGISGCISDLGSDCQHLAEYVTGLRITEVSADISSFVSGRQIDDDGTVLLHFDTGAKGVLWASQIAIGQNEGLCLRVYGDKGSLAWRQGNPGVLHIATADKPEEVCRKGTAFVSRDTTDCTRLPAHQPEGIHEALANTYHDFVLALDKAVDGETIREENFDYPNIHDGVHGMAFIDAVVKSSKTQNQWTPLADALGAIPAGKGDDAPPTE
jgi:predicted dehydrogenase